MPKPVLVISYPLRAGGLVSDAGNWMGCLHGEVWDYNGKEALKRDAVKHGFAWVVTRRKRNGKRVIVERST